MEGRSLEIPRGRGVLKAKFLEAMYENKLEFPGGGGVQNKNLPGGGGGEYRYSIFWNCTFCFSVKYGSKTLVSDLCSNLSCDRLHFLGQKFDIFFCFVFLISNHGNCQKIITWICHKSSVFFFVLSFTFWLVKNLR